MSTAENAPSQPVSYDIVHYEYSLLTDVQASANFTTRSEATGEAKAVDSSTRYLCTLLTEPITTDFLKHKGSPIDLKTTSHHQGKVEFPDKGSWSWFELAVISSYAPVSKLIVQTSS